MKKAGILILLLIVIITIVLFNQLSVQTKDSKDYEDISLKKEVIIKSGINDLEEGLINPTRICVDSKENIFILESSEKCVKKYSKSGSFLQKIGRSGNGPGELKICYAMKIDNNDNIILNDTGRKKLIRFNNTGKLIDETDVPFSIESYSFSTDGEVFIEYTKDGTYWDKNGRLNILSSYSADLKIGRKIDSCIVKDNKQVVKPPIGIPRPFYSKILWSVFKNNIWVIYTENYNIKLYSREGKLLKSFEGKAKHINVTEKDKKEYFERLSYNSGGNQSSLPEAPAWLVNETEFPTYKPMISDVLSDSDGNIIIKTSDEYNQKSIWDVYKLDGSLVKNVLAPNDVNGENSFLRGGYLYSIIKDKDGIFTVEKYQVK